MNKILNILFLAVVGFSCSHQDLEVKNGDIIFQTSLSSQSQAIQMATKSKWSHMGIILVINGEQFVYEAIEPVQFTPLRTWIDRGKDKQFVIKRLKNSEEYLVIDAVEKMKSIMDSFKGKHYDLLFDWSDDKMYCSELVWKIYDRALEIKLCELQHLKEFDLSAPVVKNKMRERYGENIPYESLVVSPEQIYQSNLLETVYNN